MKTKKQINWLNNLKKRRLRRKYALSAGTDGHCKQHRKVRITTTDRK